MKLTISIILTTILIACSSIQTTSNKETTNIEKTKVSQTPKEAWVEWVDKYTKGRNSKNGWLSLAGLFWLREGDNTLGSNPSNQHIFPVGTPDNFGVVNVSNQVVTFTRKDPKIKIDNKDIEKQILVLNKTVVSLGSYSFYIIKRELGFAVRLKNTENPSIAKYEGASFFPYSKSLRIPAKLIKHKTPQTINIATVYDTVRVNDSAGWLEFEYNGEMHRLRAVSDGKQYPMSLMFADETGQESTYGAGRYLDVKWPKDGSDMTVIDFNYAYNPPCSITPFATCPLPPMSNRLDFKVEAGEKYANKKHLH